MTWGQGRRSAGPPRAMSGGTGPRGNTSKGGALRGKWADTWLEKVNIKEIVFIENSIV